MTKYIISLILFIFPYSLFAQDWIVPQDRSDRNSPFEFDDESRQSGERVFNANCLLCHGNPGQANYQALDPIPDDPAGDKIQSNTDGSMHFKISEGHGLMPSFNNILSADDIWNVISYIRSFNESYVQVVDLVKKLSNLRWTEIRIVLNPDQARRSIIANVSGIEGGIWTPVPNTGVNLSAKRYFGQLPLDNSKQTNTEGNASFSYPDDLPGDEFGDVLVTAILDDQELFGLIKHDTVLNIGLAMGMPGLTEKRGMWNSDRKAPVWLQITYPVVVLGIWSLIFFVLFQLRKIYNEGENDNSAN